MSQYICIILFTYENMFGYWKDKFCNWYDEDNKYITGYMVVDIGKVSLGVYNLDFLTKEDKIGSSSSP